MRKRKVFVDISSREQNEYLLTINRQEIKNAINALDKATETKNSVSRKLCGGSTSVTVQDLSIWEATVIDSKAALLTLTKEHPLLIKHPYLHGFSIPE